MSKSNENSVQILFDSVFGDRKRDDTGTFKQFQSHLRLTVLVVRWAQDFSLIKRDRALIELSSSFSQSLHHFESILYDFIKNIIGAKPTFMLNDNNIYLLNRLSLSMPVCLLLMEELDLFLDCFKNLGRDFDFPSHPDVKDSVFVTGYRKQKSIEFSDTQRKRVFNVIMLGLAFPIVRLSCNMISKMETKTLEEFDTLFNANCALMTSLSRVVDTVASNFPFCSTLCDSYKTELDKMASTFLTQLVSKSGGLFNRIKLDDIEMGRGEEEVVQEPESLEIVEEDGFIEEQGQREEEENATLE